MPDVLIPTLDHRAFNAYIASPSSGIGEGLIVVPENFGVNKTMRTVCDQFSQRGYVVLCPDLFWRQEPNVQLDEHSSEDGSKAFALYKNFDVEAGVRDLLASLAYLRKAPGLGGKVGVVGYGIGGKLSFLMASRTDIDCGTSFYGVGIDTVLDEAADIRTPFLMHLAEKDKFLPPSAKEKIVRASARNPIIDVRNYSNAEHGFARPGGASFHPDAATQANERTDSFLRQYLQG